MIRVLVVDDHAMVRAGLERLLNAVDDIEVVGTATTGEDAVCEVTNRLPDVVLMDIEMPGIGGIEATRAITALHPTTKVIIISTFDHARDVSAAFDAGATGYFLKDVEPEVLVAGVRAALTGGMPLSPAVAARLIGSGGLPPASTPTLLTRREEDVLTLIVDGHSNKQIAKALGISEKTVKTHCGRLFKRLGVHDRTQAAVWAERHLDRRLKHASR